MRFLPSFLTVRALIPLGKIGLPVVVALCLTGCAQPSDPASSSGPPPPPAETDIGVDVSRMADQFLSVQKMVPFLHDLTEEEAYRCQEAFVERLSAPWAELPATKPAGTTRARPIRISPRAASEPSCSKAW